MESIILNHGDVGALVQKKTNALVSSVLSEIDDFNYAKYDLLETPVQMIIEDAMTIPFLSERKVIVVTNSYLFTGEKPRTAVEHHLEALLEFIEQFDGPNIVIFEVYQEKLDERKKIVKSIKKKRTVNKIEPMNEQQMKAWIKKTFNEQFKDIKEDALNELMQLTGGDYKLISNEIDKLLLFLGDDTIILKAHVEAIVSRSLEQNVFLLTDYITAGHKEKALALIKDLINMKEEPIKLLALISGQYRLFYQTKILLQKGYSEAQIAKEVKVHPYRVKLAARKVGRMQLGPILDVIDACAETDYKLKSSYLDKVLELELFILRI